MGRFSFLKVACFSACALIVGAPAGALTVVNCGALPASQHGAAIGNAVATECVGGIVELAGACTVDASIELNCPDLTFRGQPGASLTNDGTVGGDDCFSLIAGAASGSSGTTIEDLEMFCEGVCISNRVGPGALWSEPDNITIRNNIMHCGFRITSGSRIIQQWSVLGLPLNDIDRELLTPTSIPTGWLIEDNVAECVGALPDCDGIMITGSFNIVRNNVVTTNDNCVFAFNLEGNEAGAPDSSIAPANDNNLYQGNVCYELTDPGNSFTYAIGFLDSGLAVSFAATPPELAFNNVWDGNCAEVQSATLNADCDGDGTPDCGFATGFQMQLYPPLGLAPPVLTVISNDLTMLPALTPLQEGNTANVFLDVSDSDYSGNRSTGGGNPDIFALSLGLGGALGNTFTVNQQGEGAGVGIQGAPDTDGVVNPADPTTFFTNNESCDALYIGGTAAGNISGLFCDPPPAGAAAPCAPGSPASPTSPAPPSSLRFRHRRSPVRAQPSVEKEFQIRWPTMKP